MLKRLSPVWLALLLVAGGGAALAEPISSHDIPEQEVPEPTTYLTIGLGLVAIGLWRRSRRS